MKGIKGILTLAIVAVTSVAALADIRELRTSANGSATFELDGRRYNVDHVDVNLESNKKFEVVISGRGQKYQFKGDWAPFGNHRAILRIKSGNLPSTTGQGNLTIDDRNRLTHIEVKGQSRSGDFKASFDIDPNNRRDDDQRNSREISSTVQGDGYIRVGGSTVGLRQLGARLQRNGVIDLFLVTDRGSEIRLKGRWFDRQKDYNLQISGSDNPSKIEARGVLEMYSRDEIDTLEIDGRQGRDSFEVSFRSTKRNDHRQGQPGNWDINSERRGSGELKARGESYNIDKSRVKLNDNGTFEVSVWTTKEYKYSGTWRRDGDDAKLLVTKGGVGTGTVRVRGRDWDRLSLEVIDDGTRFSIRFDAR